MTSEHSAAGQSDSIAPKLARCVARAWSVVQRFGPWSLNRLMALGVAFVGFASLLLSSRMDWFYVPLAPQHGAMSADEVVRVVPQVTAFFQGTMLIGTMILAASFILARRWHWSSTMIATWLCFAGLIYPYFVMMRSPIESAEAAWLQSQVDALLWLGGDIHNNAEFAQSGWKSKVYLIDPARQLSVVPLPSWSPWEIGLNRASDLLLWLGYSNAFCQFVRRGWTFAMLGSSLLLIASLKSGDELVFRRAGGALVLFTILCGCAILGAWSLPFAASRHVRVASEMMSVHRYRESHDQLQKAVAWLPALAEDTHYVAQRGVLEDKLGLATPYVQLRRASSLESLGRYDQAYDLFEPLMESDVPAVRREALRAIMRFAVHDYNSGRFELARSRFDKTLRQQPCNVKLIYFRQIVGIRESRVDEVERMRDWMYEATNHFGFDTKKILRAAAQQHCTVTAAMTRDADRMWAALEKAKRP
jgi:tetratricopeptide (TPR) repeat protein